MYLDIIKHFSLYGQTYKYAIFSTRTYFLIERKNANVLRCEFLYGAPISGVLNAYRHVNLPGEIVG